MDKSARIKDNETFLTTVYRWLEERGEILVFIEWVASEPEPYLFTTKKQLEDKIRACNETCEKNLPYFSVYGIFSVKNYDLPLRGVMDKAFMASAMNLLSEDDQQESLLLERNEKNYYSFGESFPKAKELPPTFEEYKGKECVFGKYPSYGADPIPNVQVQGHFPIALE